ncbi:MAG: hypothetical protein ACRCVJ_05145 [Clostridium sp.]|uniref:hypothetical protein n=1 Tax=Clostridium sp. TaxID=1506 RepID=UPI003F40EF21
MNVEELNNIKNGDIINLSNYENGDNNTKIIIINENINEVTLTSDGKECNCALFVKGRKEDLNIIIKNLNLNSGNQIGIDFRGDINCDYKSFLTYYGINIINSVGNIGICISNNQTVEVKGKNGGLLKVNSGTGVPAIGNNFYTAGSGKIIFSGYGYIDIDGGDRENSEYSPCNGHDGTYAIGFYNDISNKSIVRILDRVSIKAKGEYGQNICTISSDNKAGNGGDAIFIKGFGIIEKLGTGIMELQGGNGGDCIGDYSTGTCGKGGSSIKISEGDIKLNGKVLLKAGDGGSAKNIYECIMATGGDGGDCILVEKDRLYNTDESSKVIINSSIEAVSGNGGESGVCIRNGEILGRDGGKGGNLINCYGVTTKVDASNILFTPGRGGKGGTFISCDKTGKDGASGCKFIGENIIYNTLNTNDSQIEEVSKDNDEKIPFISMILRNIFKKK